MGSHQNDRLDSQDLSRRNSFPNYFNISRNNTYRSQNITPRVEEMPVHRPRLGQAFAALGQEEERGSGGDVGSPPLGALRTKDGARKSLRCTHRPQGALGWAVVSFRRTFFSKDTERRLSAAVPSPGSQWPLLDELREERKSERLSILPKEPSNHNPKWIM